MGIFKGAGQAKLGRTVPPAFQRALLQSS